VVVTPSRRDAERGDQAILGGFLDVSGKAGGMTTVPAIRPPSRLAFATAIVAIVVAIAVGYLIVADPIWSTREVNVVVAVNGAYTTFGDVVARVVNTLFGTSGAPLVGLVLVSVVLLLTRSWGATIRTGILLTVPWALAETVKVVVNRPRPNPSALSHLIVSDPLTSSYPSGHTAFAAALVCAVVLTLAQRRSRFVAALCGTVLVLIVAWSRVYLGVHYPTDVVAAMVLVPAFSTVTLAVLTRIRFFAAAPLLGGRS
jgi:membrane-associated phospholipid phosphatase